MKNRPLVSILLPNLNTRPFLEERMDSILKQTYTNWELIIADSYSDDGAWEYLKAFADKDARISAYQLPRGLYQAWNSCIERAQGKYIYIATSDDTMTLDCIEKMVNALEEHSECDICDSKVKVIDEKGAEISETNPEYPIKRDFFKRFGDTPCIRLAPYDFFEQMNGETIYISITEVMIRRALFSKTGLFPLGFGHGGDFPWGLMAGLYANVIYLPEKLGAWRIHKGQISKTLSDENNIAKASFFTLEKAGLAFEQFSLTWKTKRMILKMLCFRFMLLNWRTDSSIFHKFNTSFLFFIKYPEELIIYPILFIYKRFWSSHILDMSSWRWEKIIEKLLCDSSLLKNM